jgi:hypothetical protein
VCEVLAERRDAVEPVEVGVAPTSEPEWECEPECEPGVGVGVQVDVEE